MIRELRGKHEQSDGKAVFRKKAVGQLFKQSIFRAHQHPESKSCLVSSPIIAP